SAEVGLREEHVLDEALDRKVGNPEVAPDDQAGDDNNHGAGDDLTLSRPLDLLELRPRLADKVEEPAFAGLGTARLAPRLGRRCRRGRDAGAGGVPRAPGPRPERPPPPSLLLAPH